MLLRVLASVAAILSVSKCKEASRSISLSAVICIQVIHILRISQTCSETCQKTQEKLVYQNVKNNTGFKSYNTGNNRQLIIRQ